MTKNTNNKQIFVERETFEKDGRTFFSYFIKGNIRGKDVKVAVVPPDRGGYTVLDIVFGDQMAAQLLQSLLISRTMRPGKSLPVIHIRFRPWTKTAKSTNVPSSLTEARISRC